MPLFGLLPYDDNERRRRLLEGALSPGLPQGGTGRSLPMGVTPINPDAPAPVKLPDIPTSRPAPRPLPGIPGGVPSGPMPGSPRPSELPEIFASGGAPLPAPPIPDAPMAPLKRPSRYGEVSEAKDVFLQGTPGRGRSALGGALWGLGPGLQAGGLAGGLGGLAAGALGGLINPRGLREMEFDERIRPQIYERFAMEDQDRAREAAEAKAQQDAMMNRMQMANIGSQIQSRGDAATLARERFDFESGQPINVPEGATALDPKTRQPVFTSQRRPSASDEEDAIAAQLAAEEGTVEEVSQGSLEGRREMLKKHLTPDEKRIVEGGATDSDNPQAVARAYAKWQKIQEDELGSIRRVTGEKRKATITQRRSGRKTPQSGAITRPRSQFNTSRFPGLKFD